MSLICLSSRGVADSANNFTNYFGGRGIEFPRNSEICMVGASIRKHPQGRAVVTITSETNTFACHYGGTGVAPDDNLMRDDIFVQEPITADETIVQNALATTLKEQITISPLRYGVSSVINGGGWTLALSMHECRNTLPGNWENVANLPFNAPVGVTPGASASQLTPTAGVACWSQDTRKLWNVDNQATANDFATELEGAQFDFTWAGGSAVSGYDGMQGGIVTGDRLVDSPLPNSWANCPVSTNADYPDNETYQQKIDLGYEIEEGQGGSFTINIFRNDSWSGAGYKRVILNSITVPPNAADQLISILFRPVVVATNAGWEVATKIAGGAWQQRVVVPGTPAGGNFPIGQYNGNSNGYGIGLNCVQHWGKNNNAVVEVYGCYDNDEANVTAVVPPIGFFTGMYWALSNISDGYARASGISDNMRTLAQTRCNVSDALGFNSGVVKIVADSRVPGLTSDESRNNWNYHNTPFCIQLPNLPISGYLGGGADVIGGATALPILGIVEGYQVDEAPTETIYESNNENWIRLLNKDSFTINEMQVRITDMYGQLPDYLDNPTHIWIKIRAGRNLEKI
jgi:hypothetical protein